MISETDYVSVAHIDAMMRRERLHIEPHYRIWSYTVNDAIVSVGCLRLISPRIVRLTSAYTLPEYRGRGYGLALLHHRIEVIETDAAYQGIRVIDVFAHYPAWFMRNGFTPIRHTNWAIYLRRAR